MLSLQSSLGRDDNESILYPSMLQLSFLLRLSYLVLVLRTTLGLTLINSTLDAAPSGSLDTFSPVCIDNARYATWGLTLEQFDFSQCQHALELITSNLEGGIYTSWDFYSRQAFPEGHEGWPLAQGAGAG